MGRKNLSALALAYGTLLCLGCAWQFWPVLWIIAVFTLVGWTYADCALQTKQPWNSQHVLALYYNLKTFVTSVYEQHFRDKRFDVNPEPTFASRAGGPDTIDSAPILKETENHLNRNRLKEENSDYPVKAEIKKILQLISRDFLKSWYTVISQSEEGITNAENILKEISDATLIKIENIDKYKVIIRFIHLYQHHLACYQRVDKISIHTGNQVKIFEIFKETSKLHMAVTDPEIERNYLYATVELILTHLCNPELQKCDPGKEVLCEIIAHNVLLPVVNMMCDTNWLHRMIIKIVSDEDIFKLLPSEDITSLTSKSKETVKEFDEEFSADLSSYGCPLGKVEDVELRTKCSEASIEKDLSKDVGMCSDIVFCADNNIADYHDVHTKHNDILKPESEHGKHEPEIFHKSYTTNNLNFYFRTLPMSPSADNIQSNQETSSTQKGNTDHNVSCNSTPLCSTEKNPPSPNKEKMFNKQRHDTSSNRSYDFDTHSEDSFSSHGSPGSSPANKMQHNIKSSYFSKLGLSTSSSFKHTVSSKYTGAVDEMNSAESSPKSQYYHKDGLLLQSSIEDVPVVPLTMLKLSQPIKIASVSSEGSDDGQRFDGEGASVGSTEMLNQSEEIAINQTFALDLVNELTVPICDTAIFDQNEICSKNSAKQTPSEQSDTYANIYLSSSDSKVLKPSIQTSPCEELDLEDEYKKMISPLNRSFERIPFQKSVSIHAGEQPVFSSNKELFEDLPRRGSAPDIFKPTNIPNVLFETVNIPFTQETKEPSSTSTYILYFIQYQAWYTSEAGELVLGLGSVFRRYREFVNLQSRLAENPIYRKSMKDVKGPNRWFTMPLSEKSEIKKRRGDLETYLQVLCKKKDIGFSPDLKEFLAYGGDAHIAFVKKAPEILNVPRIDKFVVKKMTVVKDKIEKALPTKQQDHNSTEKSKKEKSNEHLKPVDKDHISDMQFAYGEDKATQHSVENSLIKYLNDPADDLSVGDDVIDIKTIPRLDADGSDQPDQQERVETEEVLNSGTSLVVPAILSLAAQTANGHSPLITDKILDSFQVFIGNALESWLRQEIDELTTEKRCAYYLSLFRDTIWPNGELDTNTSPVRTKEQVEFTKQQATRCLHEFFPDILPFLLEQDFDFSIEEIMSSIECPRLNRHFIYCLFDMLLEDLFPEIHAKEIQHILCERNSHSSL